MNDLQPATVGILGGMGPAAGADFARLFVQACEAHLKARGGVVSDQAFPEHWLAQVPVPDRTAALLNQGTTPLPGMTAALHRLALLGAKAVAVACNTAHAWHEEMQRSCPDVELLHIVEQTAEDMARDGVQATGLIATLGTHRTGLYEAALRRHGIQCHVPRPEEQATVMHGIVDGVKAGDLPLAQACFEHVATALVQRGGVSTLVLACTEIPLALRKLPDYPQVRLVNPAELLAQALAVRAYGGKCLRSP